MPSPAGWREVPCVECGAFVPGIDFGERCPDCLARRSRQAARLARRVAIVVTLLAAAWTAGHFPASPLGRWYALIGIPITYLLVHLIIRRVAMEVLP